MTRTLCVAMDGLSRLWEPHFKIENDTNQIERTLIGFSFIELFVAAYLPNSPALVCCEFRQRRDNMTAKVIQVYIDADGSDGGDHIHVVCSESNIDVFVPMGNSFARSNYWIVLIFNPYQK